MVVFVGGRSVVAQKEFGGQAEAGNQFADHGEAEAPPACQHFRDFGGAADIGHEVFLLQTLLLHAEANRRERVGSRHWELLGFVKLDQRRQ